jgi:myosin heavy subunit
MGVVSQQQALLAMDMTPEIQDHLFTILSGIMRLGNVQFEGSEVSKVVNPQGTLVAAQHIRSAK